MRRLLLLMMLAGCGDPLVSGGFRPPYFTLTTLVKTDTPPPQTLNLALLWDEQGAGSNYAVQLLSVRLASNSILLALDVGALPPPSVINGVPPELAGSGVDPALRFAIGTLVAYADNNANGKLDIEPSDGKSSPDQILGAAVQPAVFYLAAGKPAPPQFAGIFPIAPDFSFVDEPQRRDPLPGEFDSFDSRGHLSELAQRKLVGAATSLPTSTTIELTLAADPELQRYACATFSGQVDYPDWSRATTGQICDGPACLYCRGYNCPLDLPPAGAPVTCNSDGTAYAYKICSDDATACGTTFCHYGHGARLPSDPVPAGWPCK